MIIRLKAGRMRDMTRLVTVTLLWALATLSTAFTQGWRVEVQPEGYSEDYLLLGYYLGQSQYIKDTAYLEDGKYVFEGTDTVQAGVYLVIFPPDNDYFQLLIGEGENDIHVKVQIDNVTHPDKIKGSPESSLFYEYIGFLKKNRQESDALRAQLDSLTAPEEIKSVEEKLYTINDRVKAYQGKLIEQHPESITSLLIKSNTEVEIPDFEGTTEEKQLKAYHYVRDHYFDHIPMRDPRLVRTPILHQKVDYYINKLTHQIPDSIIVSIDTILHKFDPEGEAFRNYLVYFLNTYAKSNIVGMDAVYVHLADEYYSKGLATWTDEELLNKILKNASTIRPLLIGKIAPDLLMYDRDNRPVRLHQVESPYTVLFFWDPDCGHCKKSIPKVVDFYEKYKDRGVEIFAVCTLIQDEVGKCWDAIDERQMGNWMNLVDPYLRSRYKQIYDIRSTPQIYILDSDKKIVMKKIGGEQLPEVMNRLLENGS